MSKPLKNILSSADFLTGGGEIGWLMRARDWSTSPLGSPDTWPQSLRTIVSMMINSKQPMFVAWGPELVFLYNDAYTPILGAKHPAALGRPFKQVWFETWDNLWPLIEQALAGEATWRENLHLVMERNGSPEDTWYSFSYSPVRDESGGIGGMFCACTETTQRVQTDRRNAFRIELEDRIRSIVNPMDILRTASEELGLHLNADRVGYCEIDSNHEHGVVECDWVDAATTDMRSLVGRYRLDQFGRSVIATLKAGETVAVADVTRENHTASGLAAYENIGVRAFLSVPLIKGGDLRALLFIHSSTPRSWRAEDIAFAQDMAERTWAAVERARAENRLRESEARFRNMADHSPVMIWTTNRNGHCTYLNRPWYEFTGQSEAEALGFGWLEAVHPDDRSGAEAAFRTAVAAGSPFRVEYRLRRRDGVYIYAMDAAAPRFGENNSYLGFVGCVIDIDDRRRVEEELQVERTQAEIAAAEQAAVLGQLAEGVIVADSEGRIMFVNEAAARIHGQATLEIAPEAYSDTYHLFTLDGKPYPPLELPLTRAVNGETVTEERWRIRRADGIEVLAVGSARPVYTADGYRVGAVLTLRDETEREREERARTLLINELNHRVKNTLATVQSVASQTFRGANIEPAIREAFESRLMALARAHDVLTQENWEGARLRDIVARVLSPYRSGMDRFEIDGPAVRLTPRTALAIAMILQELATNAAKYGALSNEIGRVKIIWEPSDVDGERVLNLIWSERDGPLVAPPTRKGFGTRLIERGAAGDFGGEAKMDYAPSGLVCTIMMPFSDSTYSEALQGPGKNSAMRPVAQ